ncbi:MAG: hypothetical protein IPM80_02475 [Proteobacteria bacterium]|nr:hypothetical protein [Pseudomonadota bacterium]
MAGHRRHCRLQGGKYFHSARWDHSVDVTGQRVGVIGVAASAIQFAPELAPRSHIRVFPAHRQLGGAQANQPYSDEQLAFYRAHPEEVRKSQDEGCRV